MPQKTSFVYKKIQSRWFAPIVGFFDLESIIESVSGCRNNPQKAETRIIERHKPFSYAMLFVGQDEVEPFHFECESGAGIMSKFVESLERIAKKVHNAKQRNLYFNGEPPYSKEDAEECWICEEALENTTEHRTVLDHCHFTGQFLGWAHNTCNINRKFLNYTPLFAHNLSNCDLHHVILALQGSNMSNTISIIPSTDKKFIAVEIGVLVKMRPDKNGFDKPVYEHIRLLDSFRFMSSSLDTLANNLPADEFSLLENYFKDWPESSVQMLKQKGFFPYNYIDSFPKLRETELPLREKWTNSLQQYQVSVTEDEYEHALRVFQAFKCKTIGEYYNLYLKTDVFLLAAIVLCFRKVCYQTYGLDCCQYYTASNLSGDAMLKICKAPPWTSHRQGTVRYGRGVDPGRSEFYLQQENLGCQQQISPEFQSKRTFNIYSHDWREQSLWWHNGKVPVASQWFWVHRPTMGLWSWATIHSESTGDSWRQWCWIHFGSGLVIPRHTSWPSLWFPSSSSEAAGWTVLVRRLSRRTLN